MYFDYSSLIGGPNYQVIVLSEADIDLDLAKDRISPTCPYFTGEVFFWGSEQNLLRPYESRQKRRLSYF